jgi:NAD(P)-dependent dehydrogenase (short-subunit alcohol dehydrogenase family)
MKQVLVIGGVGGLGAALVDELLERRRSVVVAGRSKVGDARIRHARVLDATTADWRVVYRELEEVSGAPIDSVLFVAGRAVYGQTARIPSESARRTFELNFWACTAAATAAGEHWTERGRPGTFLAVLSIVARRAVPFEAYYAASKTAAARMLECLQLEYDARRIRFVAAYPGTLDTSFRSRAEHYGLEPLLSSGGAGVSETARAIVGLLDGRRRARVIGWRERGIDLADRVAPGLYDRAVLRRRTKRLRG